MADGKVFSRLQEVLHYMTQACIHLTQAMHDFLDDICFLIALLQNHHTRFHEVVPSPLVLIGANDITCSPSRMEHWDTH